MQKIIILSFFLFFYSIAHAQTDHLWIGQVQITGGPGKTAHDFVEIYNPTAEAVNLKGLRLVKRTQTGSADTLIKSWTEDAWVAPGGYYLWANSGFTGISVSPNITTTATLANDNGIALRNGPNDTGTVIDSVAWGAASNNFIEGLVFPENPTANQALTRNQDTNDNASDFVVNASSPRSSALLVPPPPPAAELSPISPSPSPSTEPEPPAPAFSTNIIISEIFPNPDGSDTSEEWIEIYNNSEEEADLSGWLLDDEGADIGKDAYEFSSETIIGPKSYLIINLSAENFSLNNTGGEEVRLFWPDKTLLASIAYGKAPEDESFSWDGSTHKWTSLVTKGAPNQVVLAEGAGITSGAQTKIKINEVFPNPDGPDSGSEWIEVRNEGSEPVYLHDWIVDDGEIGAEVGSSAWRIQGPIVQPGGVAVLVIPAGKLALNNSGKETVRLFNENKVLIDSIVYEEAQENKSYSFIGGVWQWVTPSPNAKNIIEVEMPKPVLVVISEIYPEPERGSKQEEFIELFNPTDREADLAGFRLADQSSSYKLEGKIAAAGYLVVWKSASGISLNNSGVEKLVLTDPDGLTVFNVEYEDAPKNQSYNIVDNGDFVWSATLTPGAANMIQRPSAAVSASKVLPVSYVEPEQEMPTEEPVENIPVETPDIAGISVELPQPTKPRPLYPWLLGSFAANLIFCYSLIKLMIRKEKAYEQTRTD